MKNPGNIFIPQDTSPDTFPGYAENGKLLLLLVIRSGETVSSDLKEETDDVLVWLRDVMPASVSVTFRDTFSAYAKQKTNSAERIKLLEAITRESRREQRSPFFYGFYTFQEEYNLFDSLKRTVLLCSDKEKMLLNHLALVTAFSQNVCVTFTECLAILEMENDNGNMNIYVMQEMLSPALSKLMVMRNNGFRLCHKIIAEKILVLLHDKEEKHAEFKYAIYPAAENYIKTLCKIYGKDKDYIKYNDYVDKNLKELFIDRAYIDADEQKTKFSPLVEAIPFWVNKNNLFELLIKSFPENPHYYNHMARLLAFGDKNNNILPQYEESVRQGKKAISVAEECNSSSAVHRTTLGFIYGQWIIHDIREEIANKRAGRLSLNYSQLIDNISVHYNLAYDEFVNSRSNSEAHDSFRYFPQINMECNIIDHLIQFDQARNLAALIEQEPSFKEWYDEHFSIATELIQKMEEQSEGNDKLLVEAKSKLKHIALESPEQLKYKLTELLRFDAAIDKRHRRSLTYAAFAKNGASWNMDPDVLDVAQQCFRKNIMDLDGEHKNSDVQTWFELYRRTKYFDAAEAQAFIADYMEDGYKKEYLLFLLAFVLCEEGHAGASQAAVATHAKETQRLAHLRGLNTAREHDVFVNSRILGCPIVSVADVQRNENREPVGLKVFTGTVTEVEQTHGKILLNNLNLDVAFIPNPSAVSAEPKKIFTRQDISHPVELNLMFSYSGLRAWNVTKIK